MADHPTGTVTFLFTDIEGSTSLAQQFPAELSALLARHHAILHQAIQAHQGHVFQIIGDAFCAAFYTASDALKAALDAQRTLQREAWNPAPIKVRMGIHTGSAQAGAVDAVAGGYTGYSTLARTQRVMSIAHGGQVLLSNPTAELVRGELPADIAMRDMGEHRLKGLVNLEQLWQLVAPDLRQDFPPLQSLNAIPNNLPLQLTSFIGREKDIAELKRLLSASRLVTLTGSGGAGKTRLSLQVAANLFDAFPDGVWFVELAPLADPALVLKTVTTTLGLREEAGRALLDILTDYLHAKHILLILDNCEHLVEASAQLAVALLNACPKLHVIASSREVLGIPGEIPYRVPPLSIPDARHLPPLETLLEYEAVRLFIERAQLIMPIFRLTQNNAPAVAQICQRLDGIPLALELAAARANLLKVEQIAARLDDAFRLLTGSSRMALPRQQTLRATIDWSYSLLAEPERTLLRRLAVFVGSWTLEAAEAVCAGAQDKQVHPAEILDLLTALVNKSLVMVEREPSQEARYRLLETIRQYAREKFSESGEAEALRTQHLAYFLDLARRAEPEVQGAEQLLWLDRLEAELDNLRAALEWSLEGGEQRTETGLQLASHLWWFWFIRNYPDEGMWLEKTLRASQTSTDLVSRANSLSRLAWVRFYDEASAEAGLALGRTLGPAGRESVAQALVGKSAWAWYQADYPRAQSLAEESLKLFREIGHRWGICETLTWLAMALINQEDHQQARNHLEESLALARKARDGNEISFAVWQLGRTAMLQGNYAQAITLLEEALAVNRELKLSGGAAFVLSDLGKAILLKGDYQQAISCYKEMLAIYWKFGDERSIASSLEQLASVAVAQTHPEQAARLFGAAEVLRDARGAARYPFQIADYERNLESLRLQLDEATFAAQWAAGRAMTLEQAIAYALEEKA